MSRIIEGYKIMGKELMDYAVKHRSGIGTAISIGGTVVSNILSTRAGAKSARQIDAKQMEMGRPLTTMEKVKLCWTNHIGAVGTAAMSCVGANYSHNQHVKDFNKAAIAYANVKNLYDASRKATREALGEKKNIELQDKINQQYIEEHPDVKAEITKPRVNPDPSTMQKYWEPKSGIVFYSTRNQIDAAVRAMRAEMDALPPRNPHVLGRNGIYGVKLRKFHEYANPQITDDQLKAGVMDLGWNKGTVDTDDDYIGVYYSAMLIKDDTEAVIAINWEKEPGDMAYGDYVKS